MQVVVDTDAQNMKGQKKMADLVQAMTTMGYVFEVKCKKRDGQGGAEGTLYLWGGIAVPNRDPCLIGAFSPLDEADIAGDNIAELIGGLRLGA